MNEMYVLTGLLIGAGLYISYQWSLIRRYRLALSLASFALEQAYLTIVEGDDDDASDTE